MAKIKDIQLKAIKENIGHDLNGVQANIYFKNKKVGYILDDGWGGELEISVDPNARDRVYEAAEEGHQFVYVSWGHDKVSEFFEHLLEVSAQEKFFKKQSKLGYEAVVYLDYSPRTKNGTVDLNKLREATKNPQLFAVPKEKDIQDLIKEKKPTFHQVYTKLEDFIIE